MWVTAKFSSLTQMAAVYSYLGVQATCYVLGFYALAFLLRVFTDRLPPRRMSRLRGADRFYWAAVGQDV
jgi:hypothetical protein